MRKTLVRLLVAASCAAWALAAGAADAPKDPYSVEVWADALFGPDGKLQTLDVPDAAQYPPAFVERVKKQLANAKIPPVKDDSGAPATFRTGMVMVFRIEPNDSGAAVRVTGMSVGPRPVKSYAASQPNDIPADTPSSIRVQCDVGADGRCGEVKVLGANASSEALRRWAVASMRGWEFAPQRVGDKPVPGEAEVTLELIPLNSKPRDFRDPRKL